MCGYLQVFEYRLEIFDSLLLKVVCINLIPEEDYLLEKNLILASIK